MDNNELNKAIIKVLTTTFKKDALDAHKTVSEAGYKNLTKVRQEVRG